jgi:hypothetical protein
MERYPILSQDGEHFSKFVTGKIVDLNGNIIGLILTSEENEWSQIIFLDKMSMLICFNKCTGCVEIQQEEFLKDPKEVLNKNENLR